MKRILITGANSYIGSSVENWLLKEPNKYDVTTIDMIDGSWRDHDFSQYDVVYHVAGIAHADVGNVSEEKKQLYYKVNRDLAVDVAEKFKADAKRAKAVTEGAKNASEKADTKRAKTVTEGVKDDAEKAKASHVPQFIFMSSMIVYSGCNETTITKNTVPKALNFYGDSKLQADLKLQKMNSKDFKVVILRPPMIYGKGSKGNYPELAKLAVKLPIFPVVKNKRSMLYIESLCQFIKLMIDNEESGIFFPQNAEYSVTSYMVKEIAGVKGHKLIMVPGFGWAVRGLMKVPGRISALAVKAFGDSCYEMSMSEYKDKYRVCGLAESIKRTEI